MAGSRNMTARAARTTLLISAFLAVLWLTLGAHADESGTTATADFPPELVDFVPYSETALFTGTGRDTWDREIRERGWILREGDTYRLWYTGYNDERSENKFLGYATSPDGLQWTRWPANPIFRERWVEDVQVLKHEGTYVMFAEGWRNEKIQRLTSNDGVQWQADGDIEIRDTRGKPLPPAHYGTPTVWIEGSKRYLFYEQSDEAIWLATSDDWQHWTNVEDEPVISRGPEPFDRHKIALNQVMKYRGRYYGYYHALAEKGSRDWTTNVATSPDLVHWKKYPQNPIIGGNKSSAVLVPDGQRYRLYTMHPDVRLYLPRMHLGEGLK